MTSNGSERRCDFCNLDDFRSAEVFFENQWCLYASYGAAADELPWSGIILPKAPRSTAFDLTDDEWLATAELLRLAKGDLQFAALLTDTTWAGTATPQRASRFPMLICT